MGLCKLCNSCYLEINGSNLFGLTFPIIDFQMWVKNFSVCLSWRICIFMLILFTISKSFRISRKLNCWELLLFMEILSRTIPSSDHFWQVSSLNCKKLIQLCSRKDKNREDKPHHLSYLSQSHFIHRVVLESSNNTGDQNSFDFLERVVL